MKKIVILVDQLYSHGGIEKLVAVKANYWSDIFGYNVTILSTEQKNNPLIYHLSDNVIFKDLNINYERDKSYFNIKNILKFFKNVFKVQKYIALEKPEFIIVASHIPITYAAPFLIGSTQLVKEFHFTKFNRNNDGVKNKILTFIESRYDYLAVLSEEESKYYFSSNTVIIPNPVELTTSKIVHKRNQNKALFIGRIAPVKQLDKLIIIWSKFITANTNWKLHIFGETNNEYFIEIERLIMENNLKDFVIIEGQSENINSELASASVLLMTSAQECFPMVILEANAAGVPVISFDSPTGPRNIINHNKDGILVDYNDIGEFVVELNRFTSDKNLQQTMSFHARENAKNYAIDIIMNKWNTLIFKAND